MGGSDKLDFDLSLAEEVPATEVIDSQNNSSSDIDGFTNYLKLLKIRELHNSSLEELDGFIYENPDFFDEKTLAEYILSTVKCRGVYVFSQEPESLILKKVYYYFLALDGIYSKNHKKLKKYKLEFDFVEWSFSGLSEELREMITQEAMNSTFSGVFDVIENEA